MAPRVGHEQFPPPPIPERGTLRELRAAVQRCQGCDLYRGATQAVFGEGPIDAELMLVGEQPGSREDIAGRPFVGPAGRVLDDALGRAGLTRGDLYATNVVKHFRHRMRGQRRIHERPNLWQVRSCLPWLEAELELVRPRALVLLGATAARALLGPRVRVEAVRGNPVGCDAAALVTVTVHPSAILRAGARADRHRAMDGLVSDLTMVAAWLAREASTDPAPRTRSASGPSGS